MRRSFCITIIIFFSFYCRADQCIDWFKENKVFPNNKYCLNECVVLPADMATYMCNLQCEKYCSLKCEDPYWRKKVKAGRPSGWSIKSEKSKPWTKEEKDKLENILSSLPDDFRSLPLDGIYRMEKSVQIVNPGTTINDSIVLYDSAFSDPPFSLENVIVHELAHVLFMNMGQSRVKDYRMALGWYGKESKVRVGPFINSKAKDNIDEDFANNIESFLLNEELLKNKVPIAYEWISKKFSKKFKMKDKCKNDK